MDKHLVIFVKAPRLGAVKTRLGQGIGQMAAWQFYRRTTQALLRRLVSKRWRLWLAVTPDRFCRNTAFWPRDFERLTQRGGNLGRRMTRAMNALPLGPVVIIGSDIPDIMPSMITKAFSELETSDAVIGPANDGGYWLVGLKRRPVPVALFRPGLFRDVRWSGPRALTDTLAGLPSCYSVGTIDLLNDIDTAADYRAWRKNRGT